MDQLTNFSDEPVEGGDDSAFASDEPVLADNSSDPKRTVPMAENYAKWRTKAEMRLAKIDLAPDLAEDIGSPRWFRGLGTMLGLGALALAFWPNFSPLEARSPMPVSEAVRDEFRSQMIMPLALGADSGRRSGATAKVIPLESAPERPQIDLVATLNSGDNLSAMLRRAGLSRSDIFDVTTLITSAMPLEEIEPGTKMDITLGRRSAEGMPRPLTQLTFRARFDLEMAIARDTDRLLLARNVIRVDDTPLRLRGKVGSSLYKSMRAAGAPASAVQAYIKAIDGTIDLNRQVHADDQFDMIVSYRRAATGERQAGQLLYAGLERDGKPRAQLMRWGADERFYEASGNGEARDGLIAPVPGRMTSRYGMRKHPILGYRRMHAGLDFRAGHGTPIVAVTDGRVSGAGRMGGCGNAVRLNHDGNLSTRYCHMSRISVRRGQTVKRGQVIGYVGSTGLSTGPHLHYEMYRGGKSINPQNVKFVTRAKLAGNELAKFREALDKLKTVEPGVALADLETLGSESEQPEREIEKLDMARRIESGSIGRGAP